MERDLQVASLTVVPWERGNLLVWDVIYAQTPFSIRCYTSYSIASEAGLGAVAAQAEERREATCQYLDTSLSFIPVVVETTGVFGPFMHMHFLTRPQPLYHLGGGGGGGEIPLLPCSEGPVSMAIPRVKCHFYHWKVSSILQYYTFFFLIFHCFYLAVVVCALFYCFIILQDFIRTSSFNYVLCLYDCSM